MLERVEPSHPNNLIHLVDPIQQLENNYDTPIEPELYAKPETIGAIHQTILEKVQGGIDRVMRLEKKYYVDGTVISVSSYDDNRPVPVGFWRPPKIPTNRVASVEIPLEVVIDSNGEQSFPKEFYLIFKNPDDENTLSLGVCDENSDEYSSYTFISEERAETLLALVQSLGLIKEDKEA